MRHSSNARLHQSLGDFLIQNNEQQEAMDQYNIALRSVSRHHSFAPGPSSEPGFEKRMQALVLSKGD